MPQKICVISFDHWNYDYHIVEELKKQGHESHHIKMGQFKHKNIFARISNSLAKIFTGKNPKAKKRQNFIVESLEKIGKQDQILVINPETISIEYHTIIKSFTNKYIAYLYDSVARNPVGHLLNENLFDAVFSFDKSDCENYDFKSTTNYIYFNHFEKTKTIEQDIIYIGSIDDRLDIVNNIGHQLNNQKISYKFYSIGKKAFVYSLKQIFQKKYTNISFQKKKFSQTETLSKYNQSNIILDIIRPNQTGLSFRIFEALGLQKKIITNNQSLLNYNLKDLSCIKVIDLKNINLTDFLESKPNFDEEIIAHYRLQNWVKTIFSL